MRRVVLSLGLVVALNCFGFAQVSNSSPQRARSLDETTGWLKQMLVARAKYIKPYRDGSTVEYAVDSINFEDCNFRYRDTISYRGTTRPPGPRFQALEFTFIVPLTGLDPARVQVEADDGRAKLFLFTLGDKPVIKGIVRGSAGAMFPRAEAADQPRAVITFDSLASVKLVVPAFKQAIQLCQKQ